MRSEQISAFRHSICLVACLSTSRSKVAKRYESMTVNSMDDPMLLPFTTLVRDLPQFKNYHYESYRIVNNAGFLS